MGGNKKKKNGDAAAATIEDSVDADATSAVKEPEEAKAEEAVEDEVSEGEEGETTSAAKKKKKKKKKKTAGADDEVEAALNEEATADGSGTAATSAAKTKDEEEDDDDGEDDEAGAAEGDAAKKKKKKKKKKAGSGAQGVVVAGVSGASGIATYGISDEDFEAWCKKALESTDNESLKMEDNEKIKPPKEFWGHTYTGKLRPAYVTKQMKMPDSILKPDYALEKDGSSAIERQGQKEVPILEGKALDTMKKACRLGREILDTTARFMKPGVTGDQIDRICYQACVERKIYPSPLNYYRFPKTLCVSPNEVICHGIPDCRPIEEGDIVNLDISIFHEGFHSDLNETFFIGQCDEESQKLLRTAYNALLAASEQIKPGTFYRDLGDVITKEASKNGCAVVTTYCGHGIGECFHGAPKVPHYRKNKAVGIMKPGHIFTVEPMLNLGSNGGDKTWPDNWTAVTRDGKRSAQFEHTFLVTETGVEVLTARIGTDPRCMPPYDPGMFQR